MSAIPEAVVALVVSRTSERMATDPDFTQVAVGSFVQSHPDVSRYAAANTGSLGGEGVIHVVFHAEVMVECFREHLGRDLPPVGFVDLDAASRGGESLPRFRKAQPALHDYLRSNVEDPGLQEILALIGLAFDRVAG